MLITMNAIFIIITFVEIILYWADISLVPKEWNKQVRKNRHEHQFWSVFLTWEVLR